MQLRSLPWRAILLSPLASIPVVVMVNLGSSDAGVVSDLGWGLYFAVTLGLPVAYAGMVVVGLPTYLLLARFKLLNPWLLGFIGTAIPFVLFVSTNHTRVVISVCLSGAVIALVAFFLLPMSQSHLASGNTANEA